MASIFSSAFGSTLLSVWYHFAIMFEALFILTTVDAGTRVARFMLQDLLGNVVRPLGRTSWYPSVLICSGLVVAAWGYFLYYGTIDPLGGINSLWPLFGIANQMLAAIALCVATTVLVKSGRARFAWVTVLPLVWLVAVTSTAAWDKLFSPDLRVGFLSHANDLAAQLASGSLTETAAAQAPRLIFNDRLDAALTLFFLITVWVLVVETARICHASLSGRRCPPLAETPHVPTRLVEG
jgi:carbon starvation protein